MGTTAKYDVGIYGLWYGKNYGSIITYYALDCVLRGMGCSTVMISNPLGKRDMDIDALPPSHELRFAKQHYAIAPYCSLDQMPYLNQICDTFLVGSDQMWNYHLSRPYRQSYFLDFASSRKNLVSYATSFGRYPYNGPEEEKARIRKNLSRFHAISVRDSFSLRILKEDLGLEGEQKIDPVFLCGMEDYERLIAEEKRPEESGYIFAYILDPRPEIGKSLKEAMDRTGKRMKLVFDKGRDKEKAKENLSLADERLEIIEDPTMPQWLGCFRNADLVLTDSFHGTCFSIIFRKEFVTLRNNARGGIRFSDLLEPLGLAGRMVERAEDMAAPLGWPEEERRIDYAAVYESIGKLKRESMAWLKDALARKPRAVTSNLETDMCMGCGACASACPKDALRLAPDILGYYRAVLDYRKCVDCGKCTAACPACQLPARENAKIPRCYEFMAADEEILMASSSGGAFSVLAGEAFRRSGIVAGAAWREDASVEHVLIEKAEDLPRLRKSKYLQSYLGTTFRAVREALDRGRFLLFSGCPCQVAGLKKYLGKDYKNLVLVDLLCGNSPSPMFFRKYIEQAFPEGIRKYDFRTKARGHNATCVEVTRADGEIETRNGGREDDYQRVYHNHTMCPPHCEMCRYQEVPRFGDLTIGDFWGISRYDEIPGKEKGVSVVLSNNGKGAGFLASIPPEKIGRMKEVPLAWLGGNGFAVNNHNWKGAKRDVFYRAIQILPFREAVDYALKPNHGVYPGLPEAAPLIFRPRASRFSFDPRIWEEHHIDGNTVFIVKAQKLPRGIYATLPLNMCLERGREYLFRARFKVRTTSEYLNFHVKDSGSNYHQILHWHAVKDGLEKWVDLEKKFVPDADFYDEFMFGASQLQGEGNYLAIDYLYVILISD